MTFILAVTLTVGLHSCTPTATSSGTRSIFLSLEDTGVVVFLFPLIQTLPFLGSVQLKTSSRSLTGY